MFGDPLVSPGGAELPTEIAHIARDPLDPLFGKDAVQRRVRRSVSAINGSCSTRPSSVGSATSMPTAVARRDPWRTPGRAALRGEALAVLHRAREVMQHALAQGGTSFDALYVNVNGSPATSTARCTPTATGASHATGAPPRSGSGVLSSPPTSARPASGRQRRRTTTAARRSPN
ncbi:MAG: hypothetical protein U0R78_09820 [Nocardioidaceae bacterium]